MAPPPPRRPAPPLPTMPTPTRPTHSTHPSEVKADTLPAFYNADALKSLNGNATHHPAPRVARDPARRRAGAFQKFSPRTQQPCSPRSPYSPRRTPRTPRRRCSAMATGSPQWYKTVGEASVERALGSMMHSLRLAASSPGREISHWSSSTDGSSSGAASSFASFFRGKTQSADSAPTADTSLASNSSTKPADAPNTDAASIKSVKSAHSLRSVRSFASFRSARSAKSVAAASTKSSRSRKWHWGHKNEGEEIPPIPAWHAADAEAAPAHHFAEGSEGSSGGYHPFKERPRKIVEGFLKRLTPRRRPRQPQGMYLQDPSPTVAEHVYVHDESTPSSLGRASGSAVSTPFEDDEVLRSSAKALAVLGLIDSRHAHSNHGHSPHVSRPQSLASDGHSESSQRGSNVHLKTASGGGLRRSDARASRSPARNRASSRPVRRTEASASAEWPTRPHSADGERATASALPPRRSSLRIPPVRRIESASGSSGVLSPAPSFSNLWGSRSSSADDGVEETWATPPPPPRRRPGLPNSSLSSFSSGQLSSNQSLRSSLDVANRRSPAGIRSLQHVSTVASHMAEVEAADSDEILTPRSKAMSTFSSDAYDEQDAVTFDTPRRSRQPTSKGYDSPRMHALVEDGKIHDSLASLSLDEGHMSQRRARAAALAAAADPLKPRRLICEMRSRSRCRASETEADAPIDFSRSPAESARSIPLPPSPDAFRTWTWNDSDTSLPYGRKGCHSPSASVHTFGPGGMSHLRSGSVDTMASLARRGSMASAGSVYTVRDSDTVELLYGQYGQPSETWEYDEGDRPIDFTRALAYSQPTTWTRPGTPEEYEDHVPVTVNNGVTVW